VSLCVIAAGIVVVTSTDPTGGSSAWSGATVEPFLRQLVAVSCPSARLCVAVDWSGGSIRSVDPAAGASGWTSGTVVGPPAVQLTGVSCPTTQLCFTVGTDGRAFTTPAPAGAGPWTGRVIEPGYNSLRAITCAGVRLCVAYDNAGNVVSSRSATTRRPRWHLAHLPGVGTISGLVCPAQSRCVGFDDAHHILSSTDPAGPAASWQVATVDPQHTIESLACPSPSVCVAVDDAGDAITSTSPTSGPDAWTITYLNDTSPSYDCSKYHESCYSALADLVCGSVRLCAAVDQAGSVIASANPAAGPAAWHTVAATTGEGDVFERLQCAFGSFCFAIDANSDIGYTVAASNSPTRSGTWRISDPAHGDAAAAACASPSLCLVANSEGRTVISHHPAAPTPRWTAVRLPGLPGPGASVQLSCPAASICVALENTGRVFSSTDPSNPHRAWSRATPAPALIAPQIACPTRHECLAVDAKGDLITASAR
jgi:hypothetical protein